jgi:hypothetical protein
MLWVTWRQHRVELFAAVLLLLATAIPLLVTGVAMHHEYRSDGIAACVADPTSRAGCAQLVDQFVSRHAEWGNRLIWVAFLPALAGVFIGAPLLAREFEHGTWRLALTQSVTRTRWLSGKIAVVGMGLMIVAAAFAGLFTWWRAPLDDIAGRLHTAAFVVAMPSLPSVTLFAFAAGALAGALIRRTIAAMATTLVAFVAVRIPIEEYLRPHYLRPRTRIVDPATHAGPGGLPSTDWTVNTGLIDSSGHRLSEHQQSAIVHQVYGTTGTIRIGGDPLERYLVDHGLRHYIEYQPNSSFWAFQAIDSVWFLGTAAILLAITVWLVRRA